MFQSKYSERLMLTKQTALLWMSPEVAFSGNRPISDLHLRRMIRAHLRDGIPETDTIHCSVNGGDSRNLDSQHRCMTVIETDKPLPVRLHHYDVHTNEDRSRFWKMIDQGQTRSFNQAIDADEWREAGYANKSDMVEVGRLCDWIESKLDPSIINVAREASVWDQTTFAREWASHAAPLYQAMEGSPTLFHNKLRQKHVFVLLLATAQCPLLCHEESTRVRSRLAGLTQSVANNDGLLAKTAAHRFFQEAHAPTQINGKKIKLKDKIELMRRLAYCINRHIEDEPCIKVPTQPQKLYGTDITIG